MEVGHKQTMGPFPGSCEIFESKEELSSAQHLKKTNPLSCGSIVDDRAGTFSMLEVASKYTLEDDINQLFEAINLRNSTRGLRPSHQLGTDSLRKSASKKPIRGGVSQASGIGISESLTLKQALRGLCISHASETAAMKRLSKSVGTSGASEAGAIKRLYRAVVIEANESGRPLDGGKGSLVEICLVPEKSRLNSSEKLSLQTPREKSSSSSAHPSPRFAVADTTNESMIKAPPQEEIVPVPTEIGRETSSLKLGQEGKLKPALSLSSSNTSNKTSALNKVVSASMEIRSKTSMLKLGKNLKLKFLLSSSISNEVNSSASLCVVKPVLKNKCFLKKKMKQDPTSVCSSSDTCNTYDNNGPSPNTSKFVHHTHGRNQRVIKESASPAFSSGNLKVSFSIADSRETKSGFSLDSCNKRIVDTNVSECSRSREKGDFSQSSKSSVGEYSNSTCISEESNSCGSSCSGSRPHMSKDLRWDAIRRVQMQHGSLGLKHFKLLKRLGCGDIGTVYLSELTGTNCLFAVKVMDNESLASKKKMPRAQTERDILQMLDHPFLPTLFAHFTTNKFLILVMEYCPGGDLHILRQKQPGRCFTEQAARFYVAEVLLALEYLHMLGVVYRDLKPENILVREDGHIMLSDFDLSLRCTVRPTLLKKSSSVMESTKKIPRPCCMESSCIDPFCLQASWVQVPCFTPRHISTSVKIQRLKSDQGAQAPQLLAEPTSARSNSFVGTHEYLAPEIIKGEGHGNAVDWWTFGIFLYELLFGETPFKGLANDDTLANVVLHNLSFPKSPSISLQAKDLIKGLLIKEPENRLGSVKGAAEIRQHPFFKGLNWALIRCAVPPVQPKSCDPGDPLLACEENKLLEFQKTGEEHPEFENF